MKTILISGALAAALLVPAVAAAEPPSPDTAAIDQRVAADRDAVRAAYATKDPKKIAEAQARARKNEALDYQAHHPRESDSAASVRAADATAARDREALRAALVSKDKKRIAQAEAASRKADRDAYIAHHPRKPT